jgi:hypothetical protein
MQRPGAQHLPSAFLESARRYCLRAARRHCFNQHPATRHAASATTSGRALVGPPTRRTPGIRRTRFARHHASLLAMKLFALPEYPYTRSFSNRTPVLSSLSGQEV